MASNVVIVESPAKAKTINKYLGSDYAVIASYGHVRDLVNKDGSVLPDEDFKMRWQLGDRAKKNVSDIKKLVKAANTVWLATDPDREGEAISWHINEIHSLKVSQLDINRFTSLVTKGNSFESCQVFCCDCIRI